MTAKKVKKTKEKKELKKAANTAKKDVVVKVKVKAKTKAKAKPKTVDTPEEKKIKTPVPNHIVIHKSKDENAKWFVVHTYSGHENKVAHALKQRVESMSLTDKVLELLVPTQNKIRISKGKKQNVAEKIFPGYLLVKMVLTDNSWLAVRTTPGVTGFVGVGNKPTPLPANEVKTILQFMKMEAPKYKAAFSVGEAVKIIEGPFADFLGTVEHIDEEKGKVRVLVSIFGRETPVELDLLQTSKI
ncbi:transcription termination/antitermination protein NusG [Patescibacteria group bacterium]